MALDDIRGALSGLTGRLPRRAVALPDGGLGERRDHPELSELSCVSVACESIRKARNEPVFSRHTPHLLHQCFSDNDPEAWRALLDDVATADLDATQTLEFLAGNDRAAQFATCAVTARSGMHMWLVVRAMEQFWPALGHSLRDRLSTAFQTNFSSLASAIANRTRDLTPDQRAGCITALGTVLAATTVPLPKLEAMLDHVLRAPDIDLLRLFLFAPVRELAERAPALVARLVDKAQRSPQAARYPACALLAALTKDQLQPHADRVLALAKQAVDTGVAQGTIDAKLLLACGVLIKAVATPRSLEASLAHALCCTSHALCRTSPSHALCKN